MANIDPATQQYFDTYFDLFTQPGWQKFMEELKTSLANDQSTAVARCNTDQLWFEERGMQMKTARILNFENMLRQSYEELIAEPEEDIIEDSETEYSPE